MSFTEKITSSRFEIPIEILLGLNVEHKFLANERQLYEIYISLIIFRLAIIMSILFNKKLEKLTLI